MPDFMLIARDLNLKYTIESGQPLTFYSDLRTASRIDSLSYVTEKGLISLKYSKESGRISYKFTGKYSDSSASREITSRLGLDYDLKTIYGEISTDQFMAKAIAEFYGMRITKNEPWETTLCFLVSQFNNIKRIRGIMARLSSRFGDTREVEGRRVYGIPSPDALADATLHELRLCGTGFRDKYIRSVARAFALNGSFQELYSMPYEEAKRSLCAIDGIGDKVADCILLFGYGRVEAFPIDLWVKRVVENVYFGGKKQQIRMIHNFAENRWGAVRGYAQQYVFWHGRNMGIGKRD